MPRLPQVGGDLDDWGNILNEFLEVSHDTDGTIKDSALPDLTGYATKTGVETITNKTLSGANNTFSDIPTSAIATTDMQEFNPPLIYTQNTAVTVTGTLVETEVYSQVIPGGSMGVNGSLDSILLFTVNNNADSKTIKVKINGTAILQIGLTTTGSARLYVNLNNRNSETAQVAGNANSISVGGGFAATSSLAASTFTFNTAADLTLSVTIQVATSTSNTGTLEYIRTIVYKHT